MFQQFEGNIHGMLERIELLEAAAISNQRQLHSPPVASSPATFSPSSPPQPSSPTLSPSVPSSSPSLLPKPTSLPNPSFIPTILITPATPNVPAIPLPQPKPATPSKTTTPKTIPPPQPRRVTPSVPKTSSSLLAPSTPLPKPLDPLDSFPTKEPLIGRVVLRPPSPPALEDLGVPQQRGPECRAVATAFQVKNSDEATARGLGSPRDWTTQWGSSCNEDATTEHRNGTCSATSTTTRSTSTFLIVFFTTTISTPAPIHATNSRRTVTTTAQLIYCPASLGPSATGQTDSTSCSATQPPAGAILTLQKKE
eukprot:Em0001g1071a